ncbi:transposase [Alphaproteobacteria bacterium]|nr:transposase [Alphaproteobacteria bacterium]
MDESGIDEILHRPYARSPRKTSFYSGISGKRIPQTMLIVAYNEGGFKAPFYVKGHTNTMVFNCWVEKCLLPDLKPGQTVVLDNVSFHKSPQTTDLIESVGGRVFYQPPYSPDLNKNEPLWANLKNRIRNTYDSSKSFIEIFETPFKQMCHG